MIWGYHYFWKHPYELTSKKAVCIHLRISNLLLYHSSAFVKYRGDRVKQKCQCHQQVSTCHHGTMIVTWPLRRIVVLWMEPPIHGGYGQFPWHINWHITTHPTSIQATRYVEYGASCSSSSFRRQTLMSTFLGNSIVDTNSSPLKIDDWKTTGSFWNAIFFFRCYGSFRKSNVMDDRLHVKKTSSSMIPILQKQVSKSPAMPQCLMPRDRIGKSMKM